MGGKLTKIDLKSKYYDIEKQLTTVTLDIDKHLTAVLRSTDIKGLKPEHREEFQEVTTQYHHDLDKKTNNIKKISREIVLYKKKKTEKDMVKEDQFLKIKEKCEKLMTSIASEESYSEGLKKNWKMITGGLIAAHVGALLVGLVVLHLIPIVNIVLGLATLIAVCFAAIAAIASAAVLLFFGTKAMDSLKKDFQNLNDILHRLNSNSNQIHFALGKIKGLEEMPDLNDLETFIPDIEQACINFDQVVNEQLSNQILNIRIPFFNIKAQR
ncbi:hypothetical protein PPL_07676 [Heterostelium album PN500]|uniref:Uncharacterized protein n=1 Tax=Heterostelium pallidum (strain ATCC 26659 / Pp 5 / PN500) TaxID=670386 RepID=D3BGM4_HETP5|nr:hypothetical protein PPL_07676 [Heterostelium album PN500]EFA79258.1 hypothetical protein PPL_07676 [Heterostelium album PN500]|eukprot:XP_020431379.1 hypothetical protein PPL_07676 [Heterostelium album PN500]